jgi:hypothetical protein
MWMTNGFGRPGLRRASFAPAVYSWKSYIFAQCNKMDGFTKSFVTCLFVKANTCIGGPGTLPASFRGMNPTVSRILIATACLALCQGVSASTIRFAATLDGPSESPPVPSPGTGSAVVNYDSGSHLLKVDVTFSDLIGTTTVAHIHAPTALPFEGTAGVATFPGTFPGFPAGVTSGAYSGTWDLSLDSSYTASFLTASGGTAAGAEAALLAYMDSGRAYVNVHTSVYPPGEIRGFLTRVPDSSATASLLGISLLAMLALRRRLNS